MKTATATVGTSLEVLQHYLAAGIQVEYVTMHTRYPLRVNELQQSSLFIEQMYALPFAELLPVLRPFSALCTPLEDGTVPAIKLGEMIMRRISPAALIVECKQLLNGDIRLYDSEGDGRITISTDWALGNCGTFAEYDYLRSLHFAVGLKPHQYVEKAAATPIQEEKHPAG